ncbi:hypothetical protein PR048_001513 [Dryococelus australis]|uniref:DDE-1 domain-containing protein n=1 Tax=Dryococelus australis TaxID=614101 RepID=A0ABQ9IJ20_9NEOP|nr:hypothetical protein PR048_001513 [Dryococelus australis]
MFTGKVYVLLVQSAGGRWPSEEQGHGLNAALFYENPDVRSYVSLIPTSAITGEGMGNLLALIVDFCQNKLAKRLMYSEELQSHKLKKLTLQDKWDMIRVQEKENSNVDLATKFDVGKTQVADILKNMDEILKLWMKSNSISSKHAFPKMDSLTVDTMRYEWFSSVGWLDKFSKRDNILYKSICGEAGAVDENVVAEWKGKLEELYKSLFCALPDKTIGEKKEKYTGGKLSKEWLTVMLCVNMEDEFEKPLVIRKVKLPRSFRGVDINSLSFVWRLNKLAWMTKDITTDWLVSFDSRMRDNMNMFLFMDNAASHPNFKLTHVKIIFLPFYHQIQPLPVHYRQKVLWHLLCKTNDATLAEFAELLTLFSQSTVYCALIDNVLQTEDPTRDVHDLVAAMREEESAVTSYDANDPDKSENIEEPAFYNAKQAMAGAKQLKCNFLKKKD